MSEVLRWPDDFVDAKPITSSDIAFAALFNQVIESGATVHVDRDWSLFGFTRGSRLIEFIRRGRGRNLQGESSSDCDMYWEVLPSSDGVACRLGTLFGIRDYACVVVCGISDIRLIALQWLDGKSLSDAVVGVTFWDRSNPKSPLRANV